MASEARKTDNHVVDPSVEHLAKVYAKALLDAAGSTAGNLVDEIEALVRDVIDPLPDFEAALTGHSLMHEQRESLIDTALGSKLSPTLLNFLKVLSQNGRLQLVRPVARLLRRMHNQAQNRHDVEVRVAQPLTAEQTESIRKTVADKFGIVPTLDVVVDPEILGGIVIRQGDTVYDGSVRLSLERLRTTIVDRAIEAIEEAPKKFMSVNA